MKTAAEFELSYQLSVGAIDSKSGVITGATVAVSGVQAMGKFVWLDKNGKLTSDPDEVKKKLQIYTDEKTLKTLMGAAQDAGGVLKIRSDHSDALDARAGYAKGFAIVDNRVTADLYLNSSYRDRDIVLETAEKTPKLIGLSIDMIPSFDIEGDKALMRVEQLLAVDIVDAGAITPEGLFLNRGVDKLPTINNPAKINNSMATETTTEPTVAELSKLVTELSAKLEKLTAAKTEDAAAIALKAELAGLSEKLAAQNAEIVTMKKEKAALGLNGGGGGGKELAPAGGAETEEAKALKLAAEKAEADKKNLTFEKKVDLKFKEAAGKMKRSDCSREVMREEPELYAKSLAARGLIRMTA